MSKITPQERAANCMAAADEIYLRCERGVELVYPGPGRDPGPKMRRQAAAFLLVLIEAGGRLARTAKAADPEQYREWKRMRLMRWGDEGPDREDAEAFQLELVETAWPR